MSQWKETAGFNPNLRTDLMYSESFSWILHSLQENSVWSLGIFLSEVSCSATLLLGVLAFYSRKDWYVSVVSAGTETLHLGGNC